MKASVHVLNIESSGFIKRLKVEVEEKKIIKDDSKRFCIEQ